MGVTALALLAVGCYWGSFDREAIHAQGAPAIGAAPELGVFVQRTVPPKTTVLLPKQSDLFTHGVLNERVGRLQFMFYAHRDVYAVASADARHVCPLVHKAARAGSPVVVLTDKPYAGRALSRHGRWALYAPKCGESST